MIPMHPEAVPGHPEELRWVVATPIPPSVAQLSTGGLAELLADGTLVDVRLDDHAVLTRLGPGRNWSREGQRVRSILYAALEPTEPGSADESDTRLLAAARDLLDGPVGDFARSHGGSIELVGVLDGVVEVRLGGACHGCPAAAATLRHRLELQLRQRCGWVREVRQVGSTRSKKSLQRSV